MTVLAALVGTLLACFSLRRVVFLLAAAAPPRPVGDVRDDPPALAVVVPACNESAGVESTLAALAAVDYPPARLWIVLVDDGSDDDTGARLERWAANRRQVSALRLPRRGGKAQAVEAGLAAAPSTVLVATCDADVRPRPDYFRRVAAAFADPRVGGAVGYLAPDNALASPAASYAAVEAWVHQLVTSAGKDRLDLNPPTLGGAAIFRRAALDAIGGFGTAASGDDVRTTVALTRGGWRTRFVRAAVAENTVAATRHAYWRQHLRWARDVYAAGSARAAAPTRVRFARRAETWLLSAGYLDRVVLLVALALTALGRLPAWLPASYVAVVVCEVSWGVARAGARRHLATLLGRALFYFPLDAAGAVIATAGRVVGRAPTPPEPPAR